MGLLGGPWEPFFAFEATATAVQVPTTGETIQAANGGDNDEYNNYKDDSTTTPTQKQSSSFQNFQYLFGLFLIFLQCIIQVGNAVLTQVMFEKMNVDSPILLTYVGISLLTVLLPIELWKDYNTCQQQQQQQQEQEQAGIDNAHSFDSLAEDIRRISTANSFSTYNGQFLDIAKRRADELVTNHSRQWNHRKHFMAACLLSPAIFLSDWLFNASLQTTSVSSATVLVSIQSVFVFCIAASVFKIESATLMKLLGVLCGVVGTILTALHDETNADDNDPDCYTEEDTVLVGDSVATTTKGDILAIAAAAFYALYTIQVRLYCPQNEDLYSLPLLLGYIGLVSLLVTFPIVALTTAKETIVNLTATSIGVMLLKGLFDFLISDYLMFRSIVLTSPTVATVGLGLSIPIAFVADLTLRNLFSETYDTFTFSWLSCLGAGACLIGFLFVNLDPHDDDTKEIEDIDSKTNSNNNPNIAATRATIDEADIAAVGLATFEMAASVGDFHRLEELQQHHHETTTGRIII